jgi:hypothetical protein
VASNIRSRWNVRDDSRIRFPDRRSLANVKGLAFEGRITVSAGELAREPEPRVCAAYLQSVRTTHFRSAFTSRADLIRLFMGDMRAISTIVAPPGNRY